jgi:hypothetical protein
MCQYVRDDRCGVRIDRFNKYGIRQFAQGSQADSYGVFTAGLPAQAQGQEVCVNYLIIQAKKAIIQIRYASLAFIQFPEYL